MKANELRIGLCLLVCGEITQISSGFIADYDFSLRHNFSNNTPIARDSVYPFPLTPEILEKAGFKYDEGMESYDLFTSSGLISIATDYSFFIGDNHLECGFAGGNKSLVKYLHQLQNLYFALTGEELQINL